MTDEAITLKLDDELAAKVRAAAAACGLPVEQWAAMVLQLGMARMSALDQQPDAR